VWAERIFVPPVLAASHISSVLNAKCNGFCVQPPVLKAHSLLCSEGMIFFFAVQTGEGIPIKK
jgi:hypothetical protein